MDKRQFGILKELMDAPIANTPHTCENCKWLEMDGWTDYYSCHNLTIKSSLRVPTSFVPPVNFGCTLWEAR